MKTTIGQNLRKIRLKLGLSVKQYAELTGTSSTTIVNVEQGHKGLKFETVEKLLAHTDFSIEEIDSQDFTVPQNLKETLFAKFKNDTSKRRFFLIKVKIKSAIDQKLINSEFFKTGKETNQIVEFFDDLGWEIIGTSLQNELKKHPKVYYEPHPTKKNTYLYSTLKK